MKFTITRHAPYGLDMISVDLIDDGVVIGGVDMAPEPAVFAGGIDALAERYPTIDKAEILAALNG